MRYSLKIALSSILGAMAIAISLTFRGIPFPIAPFLKIDFSEIIDLLALYLGGWWVALAVATVHFLGLMVNTQHLIGPPMKYIAVLSMYLGIYIGGKLFNMGNPSLDLKALAISITSSSIVRALAMIAVNILVLLYVAPEFYVFFENQLAMITGTKPSTIDVFLYVSYIIGSYNIIQTIFAFIPVYILVKVIKRHITLAESSG